MIIIAGPSGQHAVVVYEAAVLAGLAVTGFATVERGSPALLLGCAGLGHIEDVAPGALETGSGFIVAMGTNGSRRHWQEWLAARRAQFQSVIHPAAVVSPSAEIGSGSAILAGSIVGPRAVIGAGAIINHGASVDHDSVIEEFVNISPGARLAGKVHCGAEAFIGMNACVLQGLHVGRGATVGAGAVVTRDVTPATTVVGVPARVSMRSGG